jgi:hypothetical protein
MFISGVLVRNGGSFEDDLSLGAEGMFRKTVLSHSFKFKKMKKIEYFYIYDPWSLKMFHTHSTVPSFCMLVV